MGTAAVTSLAAPLDNKDVAADPALLAHVDADALRSTAVGKAVLADPDVQTKLAAVQAMSADGTPIDKRTKRELEIAEGCREVNSRERLRPVLESFGIDPGDGPLQPRLL